MANMDFDNAVREKMRRILQEEENARIEAEARRRIEAERTCSDIQTDDIDKLAALAGECWKTVWVTYPSIVHQGCANPREPLYTDASEMSTCILCRRTESVVYGAAARRKICSILSQRADSAFAETELPVYDKYRNLTDYFIKTRKDRTSVPQDRIVWSILFQDYPTDLVKLYRMVPHSPTADKCKKGSGISLVSDIKKIVDEYIEFEKKCRAAKEEELWTV